MKTIFQMKTTHQVIKKTVVILLVLSLVLTLPLSVFAISVEQTIIHHHARMFGKVVHHDDTRAIVYGSIFVKDENWQWRQLRSRAFIEVIPRFDSVDKQLKENLNRTVILLGMFGHRPFQKGQYFEAINLRSVDYVIYTPTWYGFGLTKNAQKICKFDLNSVLDFIEHIKMLPTNEELKDRKQVFQAKKTLDENWDLKFTLPKDITVLNQQFRGTNSWQIYKGLHGSNIFMLNAEITRHDIDEYMNSIKTGGLTPEEEGPTLMFAHANVIRDDTGEAVRIYISGDVHDSAQKLFNSIKNPDIRDIETWRLEGWTQEDADILEKDWVWISGHRILVYEYKNNERILVDQYFSLKNFITKEEFNERLNVGKEFL